jgi:hypothetical protein
MTELLLLRGGNKLYGHSQNKSSSIKSAFQDWIQRTLKSCFLISYYILFAWLCHLLIMHYCTVTSDLLSFTPEKNALLHRCLETNEWIIYLIIYKYKKQTSHLIFIIQLANCTTMYSIPQAWMGEKKYLRTSQAPTYKYARVCCPARDINKLSYLLNSGLNGQTLWPHIGKPWSDLF